MNGSLLKLAIWMAGAIQFVIVMVNIPLPRRLRVKENLAGAPLFLRQIVYVHWFYIVLIVGLFSVLSFFFASELIGGSRLGLFLATFIAIFWLLRIGLQWGYYDKAVRRANRSLDALYSVALISLVSIYSLVAAHAFIGKK